MSTLVTGITSGLGKFLHETLPAATGWKRGEPLPRKHFDAVIHCAHDLRDPFANEDMLQRLFAVPCGRFVYISSVDVHKAFSLDEGYARSKLRCEQLVRANYSDHLILRPCAMLGRHARENTLIKMLRGKKLSVTPDSTFAFIRHASLLPFLQESGTITLSGNRMAIKDYGIELGLCPEYGAFPYETPPVKPTHDSSNEIQEFIAHDFTADQGKAA